VGRLQLFADECITRAQDSALENQYHFNRIHLQPSSNCVILKSISYDPPSNKRAN
jgi:hypothetical protein